MQICHHQHNKQMSCPAMAQLLSNTLYYKRFFPYYAFNVLGGLDSEGAQILVFYPVHVIMSHFCTC
jgi:20S proteasome subunit beta 6